MLYIFSSEIKILLHSGFYKQFYLKVSYKSSSELFKSKGFLKVLKVTRLNNNSINGTFYFNIRVVKAKIDEYCLIFKMPYIIHALPYFYVYINISYTFTYT